MRQTTISAWDVVQEQIGFTKIKRINWCIVFGCSLSKYVGELYASGLIYENALTHCQSKLLEKGMFNEDLARRIKIGVSSRYSENKTFISTIREMRG